jgi:hypothetical protein
MMRGADHLQAPGGRHDPGGYLRLPFAWASTKQFAYGQPNEYRLTLSDGRAAILRLVTDKGWAMSIADARGSETSRGLFGTPHDALMALVAECVM